MPVRRIDYHLAGRDAVVEPREVIDLLPDDLLDRGRRLHSMEPDLWLDLHDFHLLHPLAQSDAAAPTRR
jgi:hypothetical protein